MVIVQGGNYILPLVTFPYLVRVLEVENYGRVSYALAFCQYFVILTGFGFNLSTPKEIAENRNDQTVINKIFSTVILGKFLLLIISGLLLTVLIFFIPVLYDNKRLIIYTFTIVIAQTFMPVWFFQGIENMKWITVINLSSKILYTCAIFILIKEQGDYLFVPIYNGISQLIAAGVGIFIAFKFTPLELNIPNLKDITDQYRKSAPFFLSRISVSLYTASNTFFLGTFGNMEMAGNFAIAEKIYNAMQGIYHPIINALYPFISRLRDTTVFKKIFAVVSIANILLVLVIYFSSTFIFTILFNEFNPESLKIFNMIVLICIIILPSILLGYPFLAAMGHPKFTNLSVVVASLIHVTILSFFAITGILDEFKVAYALLITEIIVLSVRFYGIKKYELW